MITLAAVPGVDCVSSIAMSTLFVVCDSDAVLPRV